MSLSFGKMAIVLLGDNSDRLPCSHNAPSLELVGREELLVFSLTFLMSTWYIKNPFLKSKIIEVRVVDPIPSKLLTPA